MLRSIYLASSKFSGFRRTSDQVSLFRSQRKVKTLKEEKEKPNSGKKSVVVGEHIGRVAVDGDGAGFA
jgi:hypothetical protein